MSPDDFLEFRVLYIGVLSIYQLPGRIRCSAPYFILKILLVSNLSRWLNFKYNIYIRNAIARRNSKDKSKFLQKVHEIKSERQPRP